MAADADNRLSEDELTGQTSGKGHTSCMLLESLSRSYSDNPRRLLMIPDVLLKEVRLLLKSRLSEIKFAFRSSKNNKRPWLS